MPFKILHTADWHLGKNFYAHPLIEDQKHFIAQVTDELQSARDGGAPYDAMIIAGDVYDTANPATDTMFVLDSFYSDFALRFPGTHLFVSMGNHDSAKVALNRQFLNSHNIHLCADTAHYTEPFVLQKGGESLAVYQLPYLNSATTAVLQDDDGGRRIKSQKELVGELCANIARVHKEKHPDSLSLLAAHLTTFGSLKSRYDENAVGTIEEVPVDLFEPFDYTALGHIHKMQDCGALGKVYYSGSPLPYYFDSTADTCLLRVELTAGQKPSVVPVPIAPLHKVESLCASLADFLDEDFMQSHKESYLEFVYTDAVPSPDKIARIKAAYPYALVIKPQERDYEPGGGQSAEGRESTFDSPEKYFDAFYKDVFGDTVEDKELHEEARKLFIEIAQRVEREESEGV